MPLNMQGNGKSGKNQNEIKMPDHCLMVVARCRSASYRGKHWVDLVGWHKNIILKIIKIAIFIYICMEHFVFNSSYIIKKNWFFILDSICICIDTNIQKKLYVYCRPCAFVNTHHVYCLTFSAFISTSDDINAKDIIRSFFMRINVNAKTPNSYNMFPMAKLHWHQLRLNQKLATLKLTHKVEFWMFHT